MVQIFVALAAVIVTGRLLHVLLAPLRQPLVIAEVLAGVVLGPSVLGALFPDVAALVLPASVAPSLNVLAQLGVVVYTFMVGVELDADALRARARHALVTASAGVLLPFVAGVLVAVVLFPRYSMPGVPFATFAMFIGVAMAVTAFPVLARILTDRGLARTLLGVEALSCAAFTDIMAWGLLAVVLGVARGSETDVRLVLLGVSLFTVVMFTVVRPLLVRILEHRSWCETGIWIAVTGMLVSAAITDVIGVHAIFGAFLFGIVVPHDSGLARRLVDRLSDVTTYLLMPAFFAVTGLSMGVGQMTSLTDWLLCGLLALVATVSKVGGTAVGAKLGGMGWRDATGLGVLMNTRGLMELLVLNVGLEQRLIPPVLFTSLVVRALVNTVCTSPLLSLVYPGGPPLAPVRAAIPDFDGRRQET